jgi:lipoprotein-releasing system permease protein
MSVMNGFRGELLGKILGLNGHFTVEAAAGDPFTDYPDIAAALEKVQGVRGAIPYAEGQALVSGYSESTGVRIRGIDEASIAKLGTLKQSLALGGWDHWDDSSGVAIGSQLAARLGVTVGDNITIVNPNGTMTPFGKTPAVRSYPVNVIFNLGMPEFDSFYLYLPMQPAQVYFRQFEDRLKPGVPPPDIMATDEEIDAAYERAYSASGIEVFAADPDDIAGLTPKLEAALPRQSFSITNWQQRNATFFSALQVERVVMFVILSLIILVAAFNIITSLVMLVKDKGPDIAILRTMGATRGAILRIFSMTGFAIGLSGTLLGLVLGLLAAANAEPLRAFISGVLDVPIFPPELFFMTALPSRIDESEVVLVVLLSLGLTFLATLYPAWRAARLDPIEGLRRE